MDVPFDSYYEYAAEIGQLMNFNTNAIIQIKNRWLQSLNLTNSQASVLTVLFENQDVEVSQVDIQSNLKLTNPTVTVLLDRLEIKGMIERRESVKDKRFRSICITELGSKALSGTFERRNQMADIIMAGISEEDSQLVVNILHQIEKNLSNPINQSMQ